MKIFFDFDGTLIDSRKRLYSLFQYLVTESALTFDDYWELKRNKIDHKNILKGKFKYTQIEYGLFEKKWMELIEQSEWLKLDQPFRGVTEYLSELSNKHLLYLITARQFTDRLLKQVELFGWTNFFEKIFVTNQKNDKSYLLRNEVLEPIDWFIGDTGHDIQTGKVLGIKTAAVLSGFLNEERLKEYNPDRILNNVCEFII